jgi:hypothetical protein
MAVMLMAAVAAAGVEAEVALQTMILDSKSHQHVPGVTANSSQLTLLLPITIVLPPLS